MLNLRLRTKVAPDDVPYSFSPSAWPRTRKSHRTRVSSRSQLDFVQLRSGPITWAAGQFTFLEIMSEQNRLFQCTKIFSKVVLENRKNIRARKSSNTGSIDQNLWICTERPTHGVGLRETRALEHVDQVTSRVVCQTTGPLVSG